jgi:hypothetical protein
MSKNEKETKMYVVEIYTPEKKELKIEEALAENRS